MRFFHELSMQEMFEKAYAGMERQNFARSLTDHTCAYRAADGKRCAVGHLIDDEDYRPGIEGRPIGDILVASTYGADPVCDRSSCWCRSASRSLTKAEFLGDLQRAHDFARDESCVRERMMAVARRYALDVPDEAA